MALLAPGPLPPRTVGSIPGNGINAPSLYRARIMAVNRSLWRSSGTFQALARDASMLALQDLDASAAPRGRRGGLPRGRQGPPGCPPQCPRPRAPPASIFVFAVSEKAWALTVTA